MPASDPADLCLGETIESCVSMWTAMGTDLCAAVPDRTTRLKELHAAAPWGDGPEGQAFAQAYLGCGADQLIDEITHLAGRISKSGTRLRVTIACSRSADDRTGEIVERGLGRET
ncbi:MULTISPECIES: hypothetical protein [unclassified Nonomuraea]|uniref:hypothetical protein n=1 Tax=unclassified Nonomuraea TaxID=2593643 RepID=UPI0033E73EF9